MKHINLTLIDEIYPGYCSLILRSFINNQLSRFWNEIQIIRNQRQPQHYLCKFLSLEVRAIPLKLGSESESIVPILGLKSSYAIDYHYASGAIYVTDDSKDTIYRVQQDGSQLVPIITSGLERPQGIAVDWVAENLYWTDADTNSIEVR